MKRAGSATARSLTEGNTSGASREYHINFNMSQLKSSGEFQKRFQVKQTIGLGGQAYVKEALDCETGESVAIKIFKKRKMTLFALESAYYEYQVVKSL